MTAHRVTQADDIVNRFAALGIDEQFLCFEYQNKNRTKQEWDDIEESIFELFSSSDDEDEGESKNIIIIDSRDA